MLSIGIPVYNYTIRELVLELHKQALACTIPFEIIILDDYSLEENKTINRTLTELPHVVYHELPKNIGRSKIRNALAEHAIFPYILFMDCDAKIPNASFLKTYIAAITPNTVLCGGTTYSNIKPAKSHTLRWKYGHVREVKTAEERAIAPYTSFTTFNFIIPKHIFQEIRFNEDIKKYGHEDTLFGYELKQKHIPIIHLNNPLMHVGIDSNRDFVLKTKQGIQSLHQLRISQNSEANFTDDVRLVHILHKIEALHITSVLALFHTFFYTSIEYQLIYKKPRLLFFDLYKIGYLASLCQESKKLKKKVDSCKKRQ